ncbi:MAG: chorismate-binding protein, partial [Pirellulaceae bacterium]|nr:chorismate-binding protein [Pirellulaceae bacterium]
GAYAGGVGYFAPDGSVDSCIVLRTAVVKDGTMHVQAGAGIVADSDPTSEYQETLSKARGLLKAIEITEARAGGTSTS